MGLISLQFHFISVANAKKTDSSLEQNLLKTFEKEGHVQSYEDLEGDPADRLSYIVGLFQLIIPHLNSATSLITIGRLMAIICGHTHQYSVSEDDGNKGRRRSAEEMNFVANVETSLTNPRAKIISESEAPKSAPSMYQRQFSNPEGGWFSPLTAKQVTDSPSEGSGTSGSGAGEGPSSSSSGGDNHKPPVKKESPKKRMRTGDDDAKVSELKDTIDNYCYQMIAWYWSSTQVENKEKFQNEIYDTLNQCHAHEVLFILKAVRTKDPNLVPRLQEHLLDKGSHQRLVQLLAFLYQ